MEWQIARLSLAILAATFVAGCQTTRTTNADFPTYKDNNIRLSGRLVGRVNLASPCPFVDKPGERTILVFPQGSRSTSSGLQLPAQNGGISMINGETYTLTGGFVVLNGEGSDDFQASSCRGDGFIVNSAEEQNNG